MRLIIEVLSENEGLTYVCSGAVMVSDPSLISLDFTIKSGLLRDEVNIRGLIDAPLKLKAQYRSDSVLENQPQIQQQIDADLRAVSDKINRLI